MYTRLRTPVSGNMWLYSYFLKLRGLTLAEVLALSIIDLKVNVNISGKPGRALRCIPYVFADFITILILFNINRQDKD